MVRALRAIDEADIGMDQIEDADAEQDMLDSLPLPAATKDEAREEGAGRESARDGGGIGVGIPDEDVRDVRGDDSGQRRGEFGE